MIAGFLAHGTMASTLARVAAGPSRVTKTKGNRFMTTGTERICTTCGSQFVVPAPEAKFRLDRGLEAPAQCPSCRGASRASRNIDLLALYERADSLSLNNGGSTNGRSSGEGRSRAPRRGGVTQQRYATVCAACGSDTTVPFVPRGDRPVYCRDCFNARKGL